MKHEDGTARATELASGAAQMGLSLSNAQVELMLGYLDWLESVNSQVNLTSVPASESVRLHLIDSLSALPELTSAPAGTAMDLGTGGGLPGIPLAIASSRPFVLLDSVGKKSRALATFASGLQDVACVNMRAEEYAVEHPESLSCVVARAVATLPSLVELASPLLESGGVLICLKGRLEAKERASGRTAASLCGLSEAAVRYLTLPGGTEERCVVSYRKTHQPTRKLPRRPGVAQKKPLA